MRGVHLGPPATVAQPKTRHGAAKVIGRTDLAPKRDIPKAAAGQTLDHRALKGRGSFVKASKNRIIAPRLDPLQIVGQPEADNGSKLRLGQPPHGKLLGASGLRATVQRGQCRLERVSVQQPWNLAVKRQIAARLDPGQIPTRDTRFRDHPRDLCHGKISALTRLHRLVIHNPVAHALLDRLQIGAGKVINAIRLVIVDRTRLMQKNQLCHCVSKALRPGLASGILVGGILVGPSLLGPSLGPNRCAARCRHPSPNPPGPSRATRFAQHG